MASVFKLIDPRLLTYLPRPPLLIYVSRLFDTPPPNCRMGSPRLPLWSSDQHTRGVRARRAAPRCHARAVAILRHALCCSGLGERRLHRVARPHGRMFAASSIRPRLVANQSPSLLGPSTSTCRALRARGHIRIRVCLMAVARDQPSRGGLRSGCSRCLEAAQWRKEPVCPGASERGVASAEDTTASAWTHHHPTAPRGDTVPRVSRERGEAGDERRVLAL